VFYNKSVEIYLWDGLALIRRGSDIYVNEPHISGGVPILSKTDEGVRYHEHDFLGTTLWSMDTKGNLVKDYQDTTIFGEGSIQKDRSARGVYSTTAPRASPVNPTTKTCRRMYFHTAIMTRNPPVGVLPIPQVIPTD